MPRKKNKRYVWGFLLKDLIPLKLTANFVDILLY
jgi:hypothetical protein